MKEKTYNALDAITIEVAAKKWKTIVIAESMAAAVREAAACKTVGEFLEYTPGANTARSGIESGSARAVVATFADDVERDAGRVLDAACAAIYDTLDGDDAMSIAAFAAYVVEHIASARDAA